MIRKTSIVCSLVACLVLGGCPTTPTTPTTPGDIPAGDPVAPSEAALSISATASVLQLNAAGLPAAEVRFPRQSLLNAVLVNANAVSFDWTITSPASPLIAFIVDDAQATTATGETVRVEATDSPADLENHTVEVVATLDDGTTLSATISIQVQRDPAIGGEASVPTVLITANPTNGSATNGTVTLATVVSGFDAGLQFAWSIPDGTPGNSTLTLPATTDEAELVLTIPEGTAGVFPIQVAVTDQLGGTAVAIRDVFIGVTDLTLDIAVADLTVAGGLADITLRTVRVGGGGDAADITYTWVVELDGVEVANPNINPPSGTADGDTEIDWVFSDLTPGSYRFIGTATDELGNTTTKTVTLTADEAIGLAISPSRSRVGVGNGFNIRSNRTGGDGTFTYTFSATDSDGNDETGNTTFTPTSGSAIAAAQTTIAVGGFATPDTYEIAVTVTDSFGNSATSVTAVTVGDVLSVDAKAEDLFVATDDSTNLTFDVNGGVPPYSFAFTTVTTAAGVANFGTVSPAASAGDLAVVWNAPSPGANVSGTYRVEVTVTDALGNTAIDSVPIEIGSTAATFAVEVQAKLVQVGTTSAATALLRTVRTGGAGTFDYVWSVLDEDNTDVEGTTITVNAVGSTAPDTLDWVVDLAAAAPGTYRFQVDVTDNGDGSTTVGSASILVGDVLTTQLEARASSIAPGAVTRITATPNGGSGDYSYAFTATDAEGAAAGTLSADPADGATGGVTFRAPTDGSGTYYVEAVVTDTTLNTTSVTSIAIEVSSYLGGDFVINPQAAQDLAAENGVFETGADINALGGATSTEDFAPTTTDPGLVTARSLVVRFVDLNTANLTINSIEFIGTNQRGEPIRDVQSAGLTTNTDLSFTVPFRTLDRVRIDYANAEAGDLVEIGVGEWFGLSDPFATASETAADRSFHTVAAGAGTAENATFQDPTNNAEFETSFATPDEQGVRFPGTAPDGANDYNMSYEPLTSIFVDVDVDVFILDASDGDIAGVSVDVHGGSPDFDYELEYLGTLDAASDATVTFLDGATFANETGDLPSSNSGQIRIQVGGSPGANEIHWIRVQVTDADGAVAVSTVPVVIVP